ncbi:restriction endonuclease subunit S [Glaesserella parasuis]|nr:restriction endonuclease subunit S [Glaesserella parasuis]MDP0469692.1 restriction endonuclease subunit S [Glaesserella parasuis]MDP0478728.1 restriction endonuclease subunit S [Glaesserella parasuis]
MSNWKEYKLVEVAKNASRRFDFSKHSNVIFINTGDVLNNQFLHKNYSIANGLPGQAKKAIQKGDILYSEIRPGNGRYLLVGDSVDDYVVSTKFMVIESNQEIILPEFLFLLLISNEATEYFKVIAESRSGTFPQITFDSISHYELKIPSKDIQQSIVDNIFVLDKKIELNTQINQTLEQIAQTIFKSWFIDFDPVHAKANALASGQTTEQATQAAMTVISGKNTQELHRLQTANPKQYQQLWEIAEAFPSGFDEEGVPRGWAVKRIEDVIRKIPTGKNIAKKQLLKLEISPFWIRENRV